MSGNQRLMHSSDAGFTTHMTQISRQHACAHHNAKESFFPFLRWWGDHLNLRYNEPRPRCNTGVWCETSSMKNNVYQHHQDWNCYTCIPHRFGLDRWETIPKNISCRIILYFGHNTMDRYSNSPNSWQAEKFPPMTSRKLRNDITKQGQEGDLLNGLTNLRHNATDKKRQKIPYYKWKITPLGFCFGSIVL